MEKPEPKLNIVTILLGLILFAAIGAGIWFLPKQNTAKQEFENLKASVVETTSAHELYPLFECPCCGKAINECSCPMAKERMAFVDGLTAADITKEAAVMAYIKKYGLDSFINEDEKEEFKQRLVEQAPAERPILSVNPDSYDFGDVSQKQGMAITIFEIKNEGESDLIIDKLETSCGCTSASIVYQNQEGPRFAMPGHGVNEDIEGWQVAISPEDTAQLKVYYDPDTHEDFRGTAIREIHIYSNDPIDFQKKVVIELNQVD